MLDEIWQQDCWALRMPRPEALQNYPPERSDRALWLAVGIALGLHAVCVAGLWHWPSPLAWSAVTASTVLTMTLATPRPVAQRQQVFAAHPVPAAPPRVASAARRTRAMPKAPPHRQPAASHRVSVQLPVAKPAAIATAGAAVAPAIAQTAPTTIAQTMPVYPSVARRRGFQGVVVVTVEVAADGVAQSVVVQRSSGHPVLDSAAVSAVSNWRFTPARRAGQAVRATLEVPIRFRLAGVQALDAALPDS